MSRSTPVLFLLLCLASFSQAQIFHLADLNTEQIKKLPRDKTVVIIPAGILEEHGPHLPSFTDGFWADEISQRLAEGIVQRPGWQVLLFPNIPLGAQGGNVLGGKQIYPGTYTVRAATVRAIYMDLATNLGEQGFRWIFIVGNHGAPLNNRALDEAGDYFHEIYGGDMVHLYGLMQVRECCDATAQLKGEPAEENGLSLHAGAGEYSAMLFLHPDLVNMSYVHAGSVTAHSFEEVVRVANDKNWPGYIGAPRFASASIGAATVHNASEGLTVLVLKILDGFDYRRLPRYEDVVGKDPASFAVDRATSEYEGRLAQRESDWLRQHQSK